MRRKMILLTEDVTFSFGEGAATERQRHEDERAPEQVAMRDATSIVQTKMRR
jgi:hypothetical protein